MRLRLDPGGEARFGWMWGREERAPVGATAEVRAWRCPWVLGCWQVVGWGQVTGTLEAKQRAVVSQLPCWQSLILSLFFFFNTYKIISLLLKPTGLYAILTEWLVSIDANKINMVWTMLYSFIFSRSFFWLVLSIWWPYIWLCMFRHICSSFFSVCSHSPSMCNPFRCILCLRRLPGKVESGRCDWFPVHRTGPFSVRSAQSWQIPWGFMFNGYLFVGVCMSVYVKWVHMFKFHTFHMC